MIKKILLVSVIGTLIVAVAVSAYNVLAGAAANTTPASSQSTGAAHAAADTKGSSQRRGGGNNANEQSGVPSPQNGLTDWVTLQGTISEIANPGFTLLTTDGQSVAVELGNQNYVAGLGLTLAVGDEVTLVGFNDPGGAFTVGQLTLAATGQTFALRNEMGRPLWAGGANH